MIPFQIQEEVEAVVSVVKKLGVPRYLAERILIQRVSEFELLEARFQLSLEMRALFRSLILLKPIPPVVLGLQFLSQHFGMK